MSSHLDNDEMIKLSRDCDVISVPNGEKETLKQGTEVQLMQAMGGSYTVYTSHGMFRISGNNGDAIGKEVEPPPDIDEEKKKFKKRINSLFGGSSDNSPPGFTKKNIFVGFILFIVILFN